MRCLLIFKTIRMNTCLPVVVNGFETSYFSEIRIFFKLFLYVFSKDVLKGRRHYCSVYYRHDLYYYMFLTAVGLPSVLLLTLYGSIVGVVVHRQRKVNASVAPDPAGGVVSVLSTMKKEQAARRQRRAIRVAATCAVVTILFIACRLPVWFTSFLQAFGIAEVSKHVVTWTIVIIYLHSCMNPVVYFITDDRFRSVFLRVICRRKGIDVDTSTAMSATVNTTAP